LRRKSLASKKENKQFFRSGLEREFSLKIPKNSMEYEPFQLPYTIHRNYTPDFVYGNNKLIECKGFFREGDTMKYKAIRDSISQNNQELIFLLSNPNKKVRKGGKMTMGQWCSKEGLAFYTLDTVDELMRHVSSSR